MYSKWENHIYILIHEVRFKIIFKFSTCKKYFEMYVYPYIVLYKYILYIYMCILFIYLSDIPKYININLSIFRSDYININKKFSFSNC